MVRSVFPFLATAAGVLAAKAHGLNDEAPPSTRSVVSTQGCRLLVRTMPPPRSLGPGRPISTIPRVHPFTSLAAGAHQGRPPCLGFPDMEVRVAAGRHLGVTPPPASGSLWKSPANGPSGTATTEHRVHGRVWIQRCWSCPPPRYQYAANILHIACIYWGLLAATYLVDA